MVGERKSAWNPDWRLLKRAREANGLTAKSLAEAIGKSPAAVASYEREQGTKPPPDVLLEIARVCDRPYPYFFRKPREVAGVGEHHWRSKQKASVRYRHQVVALATEVVELVEELDSMRRFPSFDLCLEVDDSAISPEELARYVRRSWGLGQGPLENVVGLLEARGIVVVELFFEQKGTPPADGFTMWTSRRPVVFTIRSIDEEEVQAARRRFTLLHELKHIITDRLTPAGDKSLEAAANSFASAMLLPLETWGREFPRSFSVPFLRALKRRWKASIKAMVYRASSAGLISSSTATRAYIEMNGTWKTNEPDEPPLEQPELIVRALECQVSRLLAAAHAGLPEDKLQSLYRRGTYGASA